MSANLLSCGSDIAVYACGRIKNGKAINRAFGMPCEYIIYVLNGEARITVKDIERVITAGGFYLIPKNTPFSVLMLPDSEALYLELDWQDEVSSGGEIYRNLPQKVSEILVAIMEEFEQALPSAERLIGCYIVELSVILSRFQSKPSHIAEECKLYLDRNFSKNISNEDLSARFSVSTNHLIFLFKKDYGMPPIKYLNKVRVARAKRLLEQNKKPSDFAEQLGFKNIFYFSRVFKKFTGISPTEYRKQK